jgi:hypothetical protein
MRGSEAFRDLERIIDDFALRKRSFETVGDTIRKKETDRAAGFEQDRQIKKIS